MASVIDFAAKRLEKTGCARKPTPVDLDTIITDSIDYLLGDWEKYARKNRLNEFFSQFFPDHEEKRNTNYLNDLNAISILERKLGLQIIVYSPGTIDPIQVGWVVRFDVYGKQIATPDMSTECHARCFALLLYLKVKANASDLSVT